VGWGRGVGGGGGFGFCFVAGRRGEEFVVGLGGGVKKKGLEWGGWGGVCLLVFGGGEVLLWVLFVVTVGSLFFGVLVNVG